MQETRVGKKPIQVLTPHGICGKQPNKKTRVELAFNAGKKHVKISNHLLIFRHSEFIKSTSPPEPVVLLRDSSISELQLRIAKLSWPSRVVI